MSNEDFVRHWMSSKNIPEVMEKTGMEKQAVSAKATYLRKAGVNLPKFTRSGVQVDATALNRVIATLVISQ